VNRVLPAGLLLTGLVTALLVFGFGGGALVPGLVFGGLATLVQILAVRALRRGMAGSTPEFLKGMGVGMALRFGGVVLLLVAILLDRGRFPPLPTALAYVGVVVPLLLFEVRLVR
jgi:hypothetical protein